MSIRQSFTILVLAATALARPALAATLAVASNGVDSATCGTAASPCRSISRAIANAAAGDTIVVGPGRYGDLNHNANFSDPGDEAAQIGTGCSCMINVDKPLTIVSRDGASTTLLDVTGGSNATDVVHIGVGGVVFGKKGKGFTLTGDSGNFGVSVAAVTGVAIAGNTAVGLVGGFFVQGEHSSLFANRAIANASQGFHVVSDSGSIKGNVAIGNYVDGFTVGTASIGGSMVVSGNLAIGNFKKGIPGGPPPHDYLHEERGDRQS